MGGSQDDILNKIQAPVSKNLQGPFDLWLMTVLPDLPLAVKPAGFRAAFYAG
jgi:hypothetical protein